MQIVELSPLQVTNQLLVVFLITLVPVYLFRSILYIYPSVDPGYASPFFETSGHLLSRPSSFGAKKCQIIPESLRISTI